MSLSLHPYSFAPRIVPTVRLFRKLLNAHRSAKKPIWITELGWTTGGHDFGNRALKATEAQQAQYLTQSFNELLKAHEELRLQRVFWHDWQDHPDPDTAWLNDMGLLRADFKKPLILDQAEARR